MALTVSLRTSAPARTGVLDHFLEARRDPVRLKAELRPQGWASVLVDRVLRQE